MSKKTKPEAEPEDLVLRPFADWLRDQSSGASHEELTEALHDLVARVIDTGKKGHLIYTISIGPLKGDVEVMVVEDAIKLKLPEHDRKASMFYPDANGNLSRTDPNQLTFEGLKEVPPPGVDPKTGEIKEINA